MTEQPAQRIHAIDRPELHDEAQYDMRMGHKVPT